MSTNDKSTSPAGGKRAAAAGALRAEVARLERAMAGMKERHRDAIDVLKSTEGRLVDDLRRSEAAARDKMAFFASVNHELRTPLNAIVGFAEALKDEMFGPLGSPRYREYAGHIHGAAQHLLGLANDLLDLARAEVGEFRLDVRPVDAGAAVRDSVAMLDGMAHEAGVALRVDIDPALPELTTDPVRLR